MHEIRLLERKDSSAYRKIRLEALKKYPDYFGSVYAQQVKLDKLYFEQIIEDASAKGKMFGAYIKEKLVGICGVTFETQIAPRAGEIIQMYVVPEYQNAGIGKKMMATIEAFCRKKMVELLLLEVVKSNLSAIRVYERYGFEVNEDLNYDPKTQIMTLAVNQKQSLQLGSNFGRIRIIPKKR